MQEEGITLSDGSVQAERTPTRRSVRLADETTAAAWRAEPMIRATQMPLTLA